MKSHIPLRACNLSTNRSLIILLLFFFSKSLLAVSNNPTAAELQKQLQERDAIIDDLLHRVSLLEDKVSKSMNVPTQKQHSESEGQPSTPPEKTASTKTVPGPGTFEIDEKAAIRALERTLTIQGALLLPAWSFEIQPSFSYNRKNQKEPFLTEVQNLPVVSNLELRSDNYTLATQGRLGLPFDSQFEFYLPLRYKDQSLIEPGSRLNDKFETQSTAWSLGDLNIGIAKTLLHEKNWWPDLIGRITWDTQTGRAQKNGISLGDGFHELEGSITAIKRLDPLALFTVLNYQRAFEDDDIKPGDQYGISLGASMAASPETSLSAIFQQSFVLENKINGRKIVGSDQNISLLTLGVAWTVGRGSLLSINPSIGLTEDSPDYAASISWSYRVR